jgi:hypothetical protein
MWSSRARRSFGGSKSIQCELRHKLFLGDIAKFNRLHNGVHIGMVNSTVIRDLLLGVGGRLLAVASSKIVSPVTDVRNPGISLIGGEVVVRLWQNDDTVDAHMDFLIILAP